MATQSNNQDPIEIVYVQLEADVSNYWKTVKKTVDDTVKTVDKVEPPKLTPSPQQQQQTKSFFANLIGQFTNIKGNAGQLQGALGGVLQTLGGFGRGAVGVEAVTGSLAGLGGTLSALGGPVGIAIAAIGMFGLAAKSTFDKVKEAAAPLQQLLSGDILAGSNYRFNPAMGVDTAVQFEQFNTEFETLLGSAEAAQARIAELADFGARTPFNLPEVVQANKLMQTFGGEALATSENLTMVGDIASATGRPFSELAMWVSRTYSAMESGRPFGEAAMRLQELGVLSGESRNKLEDLQKSGASFQDQWGAFTEIMGKYNGMMDKMSGTLKGLRSNYEDFQEQVALAGGTPVFEEQKRHLEALIKTVDGEGVGVFAKYEKEIKSSSESIGTMRAQFTRFSNKWAETFLENLPYEAISSLLEKVADLVTTFTDMRIEMGGLSLPEKLANGVTMLVEWLDKAVGFAGKIATGWKAISVVIQGTNANLSPIIEIFKMFISLEKAIVKAILPLNTILEGVRYFFSEIVTDTERWKQAIMGIGMVIATLKAGVVGFIELLRPAIETLTMAGQFAVAVLERDFVKAGEISQELGDRLSNNLGAAFVDVQAAEQAAYNSFKTDMLELNDVLNGTTEAIEETTRAAREFGGVEALAIDEEQFSRAQDYMDELIDIQANGEQQLEQQAEAHAQRMGQIQENAAAQAAESEQRYTDGLLEIDADAAEKAQKIEDDSAERSAQQQKDFQTQERRGLEDHQNELRRLREDYLFSLEDAVKNRDARAIVDLRRNYDRSKGETESQFQTNRDRRREDFSDQQRQQEENTARQLAALAADTEQRRTQLATRYEQEQMQIADAMNQQLEAENTAYAQQEAALQESLARRIEEISVAMAKEGKLTEEQAEQILTILNDTFGAGAKVDQLMDDFIERRATRDRLRGEIEMQFYRDAGAASRSASGARYTAAADRYGAAVRGPVAMDRSLLDEREYGGAMASGGLFLARKPTLIQVGEGGKPELLSVAPVDSLDKMQSQGGAVSGKLVVELTGSAPPGIQGGDKDRIAAVIASAIMDSGVMRGRQ